VVFVLDPFWVATTVFALTHLLVIADRINRAIIALLGASVMVVSGGLSQDEAIRGIDFNTIALLTGMMVLVAIARRCGMFEHVAVWSAKIGQARPSAILALLSIVTVGSASSASFRTSQASNAGFGVLRSVSEMTLMSRKIKVPVPDRSCGFRE